MNNVTRRLLKASLVAAATGSIVIGARAAQDLSASQPAAPTDRFVRVPMQGPIETSIRPRALDDTLVTVVAILAGDSVATAQETASRRLTRQEKIALKGQRAAEQEGARSSIEASGGRVVRAFQSAVNGVKVRIPRNRIDSLRQIPGIVDVKPVGLYWHDNVVSVPRIQAPAAWAGVLGVRGEGIKVAIIDTGIDYTHANFGGPGTPAAYQAAFANDTEPADPALFGPSAPKVKGGTDLVGDNYDPSSTDPAKFTPQPDPNPLDCNGHGSHVAGSAGGFGVTARGTTFTGPYDETTYTNNAFTIGPGVAPQADLYAVRVFGCSGPTDVVIEALEWAVDNDMDVVNMSLGADFTTGESADALAADNAMKAGVVVVSAQGNAGDIHYAVGAPGASRKGIAVAASAREGFDPTANFALPAIPGGPDAKTINAIDANGIPFNGSLPVKVLRTATGGVSLGCDLAEYVSQNVTGTLVVTQRGTCARVARAIFGQQAGAAAVVMINNATTLPPFEGPITSNPDTSEPFVVSIPFFGVRGLATTSTSDGFALVQRDGQSISISTGTPIQTGLAAFTSTGPRTPDSLLKPDITAPGTNIVSTLVGSGDQSLTISGTSMATPHVAGVAALTIQAHPTWKPAAIKSAIINSGTPGVLSDYATRRAGSGLVNAAAAVGTQAYAFAGRDETTVNFGFEQISADFSSTRTIHVTNDGPAASFTVSFERQQGSPHMVALSQTQITVPRRRTAAVDLTLTIPAATVGGSLPSPPADLDAFHDVAGLITFTPAAGSNRGIPLRVPYYLVPRASSNVSTNLSLKNRATLGIANVKNPNSPVPGTADFYAWGLESRKDKLGAIDLRAAGVQSFSVAGDRRILVFAINTFQGWSTPEQQEFDVVIDNDGDGKPDFVVFSVDFGLLAGAGFTGQIVAAIVNLHTNQLTADFFAVAPTNSSTILLPVLAADVGITPANPRFAYTAFAIDLNSGHLDFFTESASFNAFSSAISTGQFVTVAPDAVVSVIVAINPTEAAITPAKGLMIVTQDNKNGPKEADLITVAAAGGKK